MKLIDAFPEVISVIENNSSEDNDNFFSINFFDSYDDYEVVNTVFDRDYDQMQGTYVILNKKTNKYYQFFMSSYDSWDQSYEDMNDIDVTEVVPFEKTVTDYKPV